MSCYEILDVTVNFLLAIITLGGIITTLILTNKFTNKQIANQNKQTYRPYIRVEKMNIITNDEKDDEKVNMFDQYYRDIYLKNNISREPVHAPVGIMLELKNIGIGIAKSIKLFDMTKCCEVKSEVLQKDGNYTVNKNFSHNIAINENLEFKVIIKYIREEIDVSDNTSYLIFYEDINGNVYSNQLLIEVGKGKKYNIELFHSEVNSFDHNGETIYINILKNSDLHKYLKSKKLK